MESARDKSDRQKGDERNDERPRDRSGPTDQAIMVVRNLRRPLVVQRANGLGRPRAIGDRTPGVLAMVVMMRKCQNKLCDQRH
jgi:hypothetical protein